MSTPPLRVEVPRAFLPLLKPARYKGAYGGRGSGKSHTFAEMLVLRCYCEPTRAVGIREVQNSLKESVRQLIVDKIEKLGLQWFFEVLEAEIRGRNGSLIIFKGMQAFNAANIKSLEGFDIAWVEEAQTFSEVSLRMLRPTIRKPGSELWFSWNPRFDSDPVDKFFRGGPLPPGAVAVQVNWNDNPWFPDVLRDEKDHDYAADADMAEHVWGGGYENVTEGAYFAKLLAQADKEGRIGHFPYDPQRPVATAWDIGVDDYTAIWFIQDDGRRVWVIDYYEASGEGAEEIVHTALPELNPDPLLGAAAMLDLGRPEPYRYGIHYLPHDVKVREWGAGAKSRVETLQGLGLRKIHRGAGQGPAERINAVRRLMPIVCFDNNSRVQRGISRLRRYSRKFNDALQTYTAPLHDENSHGADAFGEFAINCPIVPPKPAPPPKPVQQPGQVVLLGPPEPPRGVKIRI